jgi:hypothetical protein
LAGGLNADAGPCQQVSTEVGDERFDEIVEIRDLIVEVQDASRQ